MYLNRKKNNQVPKSTVIASIIFFMGLQLPLLADIPSHKLATSQKNHFFHRNNLNYKNKNHKTYFGESDVWVAKYQFVSNIGHNILWRRQVGTKNVDQSSGIASDNNGNVFITGVTYGSLGGSSFGGADGWIAKYSPDGTLLWIKHLGTPFDDFSSSVAIDTNGNILVSGSTQGKLGSIQKGGGDAWVAKYNSSGSLLWIKQLGSENYDRSECIAIDSNSNIFIAGYTSGSLGSAYQGEGDSWLAKYSPDGMLLWVKQFGTSSFESSSDIATDKSGNVFVSGVTEGALKFRNKGSTDIFVTKYSPKGTQLWIHQLGSSGSDTSDDIAIDKNDNAFLLGRMIGEPYEVSGSFIGRLNAYGTLVWKKFLRQFPGFAEAIAMDDQDNIFLSGRSGPPSLRSDALFAKFNKYGKQLSFFLDGSDKPGDISTDIVIDPDGYVLATGNTEGNFAHD